MKCLALVYFDAGGGHRNRYFSNLKFPWYAQLVNLQEILDSIDIVRQATGLLAAGN